MSDPVSTTPASNQPRLRADAVASVAALVGVAAGITGYAAAWLRHRQQRHTVTTSTGVPDNHHIIDRAATGGNASEVVLQGLTQT